MTKLPSKRLQDALARRDDFLRVVMAATVIAFGVNLSSAALMYLIPDNYALVLAIGVSLVILGVLYLSRFVFGERHLGSTFDAVLVFKGTRNETVPIPGYEFSKEVCEALNAIVFENPAFEVSWKEEPLCRQQCPPPQNSNDSGDTPKEITDFDSDGFKDGSHFILTKIDSDKALPQSRPAEMLNEAIEFTILEQLSRHLSEYFHDYPDDDSYIEQHKREDIPALLLKNRVLNLLTTPLEDRAVFVKKPFAKNIHGEIMTIRGTDGAIYSRFDLVLPRDTKITRPEPGVLNLESSRLSLRLAASFSGFATSLPLNFITSYLDQSAEEVDIIKVDVSISATIRRWGLFRSRGWNYYQWFDSFAEALEEFSSRKAFFQRMNWDAVAAQISILDRAELRRANFRQSDASLRLQAELRPK